MKRYFIFFVAVVVAAISCTHEPIQSEAPEIPQEGVVNVTLVAGTPESRTELATVNGELHPWWSSTDGLTVIPTEYIPSNGYFSFDNEEASGTYASFKGTVDSPGEYIAIYPQSSYNDWGYVPYVYSYYSGDSIYGYVQFVVPSEQYPTKSSFDPKADFLISEPFTITEDDFDEEENQYVEDIAFTRMNAIVKIVLQDMTNGKVLEGQTVRKVTFGLRNQEDVGGGDIMNAPSTRAEVWNNSENYAGRGLAGNVYYYGIWEDDEEEDPYYVGDAYYPCINAIYSDETAYKIGEKEAATYIIAVPGLLKNEEWEDMTEGLFVKVETDEYAITRNVTLPSYGIALQPSIVTTLNIKLYDDGVKETTIEQMGISVTPAEKSLKPGKSIKLTASFTGFTPTSDELENLVWESSDPDVVSVEPIFYDFEPVNAPPTRGMREYTNQAVITTLSEGTATITATYNNIFTATSVITVVNRGEVPSEMVDLGLPSGTKWAQWNLGAIEWNEEGDLYAWGETTPKSSFSWDNYLWSYGGTTLLTKYTSSAIYAKDRQIDCKFLLDPEDDAANVNWGSDWYIPTEEQWAELRDNCSWGYIYDDDDNLIGYTATGSNGNSISFMSQDSEGYNLTYLSAIALLPDRGSDRAPIKFYQHPIDVRTSWYNDESHTYCESYCYIPERGESGAFVRPVSGGLSLRTEPELQVITLEPSGNAMRARFPVYEGAREQEYKNNPDYYNYGAYAIIIYSNDSSVDPGNYFEGIPSSSGEVSSGHKYVRFNLEDYENNQVCSFVPEGMTGTIYYRAFYRSTVKPSMYSTTSIIVNELWGVTRSITIP